MSRPPRHGNTDSGGGEAAADLPLHRHVVLALNAPGAPIPPYSTSNPTRRSKDDVAQGAAAADSIPSFSAPLAPLRRSSPPQRNFSPSAPSPASSPPSHWTGGKSVPIWARFASCGLPWRLTFKRFCGVRPGIEEPCSPSSPNLQLQWMQWVNRKLRSMNRRPCNVQFLIFVLLIGKIFEEVTIVEGETIHSSRWPCTSSYANPVNFLREKNNHERRDSPSSAADSSAKNDSSSVVAEAAPKNNAVV
ncbi:hypothetical protein ZWY2020_059478 [Hordeum vulgare]|nr:hypothetical protein ZWY2020_059478 [Hordeum vulgare]